MKVITLKTVAKIVLVFLFLNICISCSEQSASIKEDLTLENVDINDDYDSVDNLMKTEYQPQVTDANGRTTVKSTIIKDLKIIKTASTRYKVKSLDKALVNIKMLVEKSGGYISELRLDNDAYRKENKFTIKIPKTYFDSVLDTIGSFAEHIDYVNISTQDVTEEYMDVQTRLKTKMEVKARLETVLRKNAKTVEDILNTEEHLRIIQEEIEVAQGKLKYMTNRVAFSTINVEIYEAVDYVQKPTTYHKSFLTEVGEALGFGWETIKNIVLGLLHIWPFVIFGTFLTIVIRRKLLKRK